MTILYGYSFEGHSPIASTPVLRLIPPRIRFLRTRRPRQTLPCLHSLVKLKLKKESEKQIQKGKWKVKSKLSARVLLRNLHPLSASKVRPPPSPSEILDA
jgi:hypothetical protein